MRYRRQPLNDNHPIHRQVTGDGAIRHIRANGMAMAGKIGEMVGAISDGIPIPRSQRLLPIQPHSHLLRGSVLDCVFR